MANSLTGLLPDAYAAINKVSRSATGYIPTAVRNATADMGALNQVCRVPVPRAGALTDATQTMAISEPGDLSVDHVDVIITKNKVVDFGFTGTETGSLNRGPGVATIQSDALAESMAVIVDAMEADLAKEAALSASRAYGTVATQLYSTPAASNAQLMSILIKNGAPKANRNVVLSGADATAMRSDNQLIGVNTAGNDKMLRQGELLRLHGVGVQETGSEYEHTAGTGASFLVNGALVAGKTSITVDGGTGTILAGDVVTISGSAHQYVVATALASNVFTIHAPGLMADISDDATVTLAASYSSTVMFTKNSLVLASRLPWMPEGGDGASERRAVMDLQSGLSFDMAIYRGQGKAKYVIGAAWGVKAIKPEHIALGIS